MSRYLVGRRERWNEKYPVSEEMPGPGTLWGSEQRRRSLTRAGKVPGMEGAGAPALGGASGHLEDTQGYSGGRGRKGRGPHSGCPRSCPGWNKQILKTGKLLRFSAVVPGAPARQTGEVSRME